MPIDRFLIAPFSSGLQTDVRPWLIVDDAFSRLNNAYVFRGRVRKRFGAYLLNQSVSPRLQQLYSRPRINLGNTPGPLNLPGGSSQLAIGQMFSVGNDMFTVWQLGAGVLTKSTNVSATCTIDSTANPNTVTFTGETGGTAVYYYPSTPIMGLITYEIDSVPNEPCYAFDTQFAYSYSNSTGWTRLGTYMWSGSNSQFFWGCTYRGLTADEYYLYVTNNNNPDFIQYWDNTQWNTLNPVLTATTRLVTGLMLMPFKDRLLVLNPTVSTSGSGLSQGTTDGTTGNVTVNPVTAFNGNAYMIGDNFLVGTTLFTVTSVANSDVAMQVNNLTSGVNNPVASGTFNGTSGKLVITGNGTNLNQPVYYISAGTPTGYITYDNRVIFSQNGTPVGPSATPNATNAWLTDIVGLGGYIDASVKEDIISSQFIKDRLIVYFETSTWELAYTFNQVLPFIWQKINTELGAVSTYSTVPFDKVVIGIGDVGIHACNGSNVERIDDKIPDSVFNIEKENGGINRVHGVRDYYTEMVYWSYPSEDINNVFNNRVLVYNYKNGSWAFNDDSITCFGVFYNPTDITWASSPQTWQVSGFQWNTGLIQANTRQVIAGNQQGYIFVIDRDRAYNAQALQITNISYSGITITVTCVNHNLEYGEFVLMENAVGVTNMNNYTYEVQSVINDNSFTVYADPLNLPSGSYLGGGTLRRISQIDILTKQYNFYMKEGRNSLINKVDFQVEKTFIGQITVDYYISSGSLSMLDQGSASGALVGTGVLETNPYPNIPLESTQERLWHPTYPQADGEFIQLRLYTSPSQLEGLNNFNGIEDFQLHAMIFYSMPSSNWLR